MYIGMQPRTPGQGWNFSRQAIMSANNLSGLRGLGDVTCTNLDDGSTYCYDATTGDYAPAASAAVQGAYAGTSGTNPGSYSTSPGTSSSWAAVVNTMAKAGFTLADIQAAHPGMSISPSGQITYQNPGYAVNTGGVLPGSIGGMSTTTIMFLAVGVVVFVAVIGSVGRGR